MRLSLRLQIATLLGVILLSTVGCNSYNKLKRYDFNQQTMAVLAAYPPRPMVFTGYGEAWAGWHHPVRAAMRVGTAIAKYKEVEEAQQRLDSAFQYVDVAERLAGRALVRNAQYLGYEPVNDPQTSDFIMDVRIREYGILADSWDSSASFIVEGELQIFDNRTKKLIWRQKIDERELITGTLFGLGVTAGNVLTARALSRLTTEQMTVGLEAVAEHAAEQISRKLQHDYFKSR